MATAVLDLISSWVDKRGAPDQKEDGSNTKSLVTPINFWRFTRSLNILDSNPKMVRTALAYS
jgi:hypothetical protein